MDSMVSFAGDRLAIRFDRFDLGADDGSSRRRGCEIPVDTLIGERAIRVDVPTFDTYVSLCSGVGGLDQGVRMAMPSARCICLCEREAFAVAILAGRMEEGRLDPCPVWSSLETFPCALFRGKVGGVVAGFPCPPVSVAGRQKGQEDERWLWPEVWKVVRGVEARWVFLENVRGLLSARDGTCFGDILRDLASGGFHVEWLVLSAAQVGASHRRERVFVLAYHPGTGRGECKPTQRTARIATAATPERCSSGVADAGCAERRQDGGADGGGPRGAGTAPGTPGDQLGDPGRAGRAAGGCQPGDDGQERPPAERAGVPLVHAEGDGRREGRAEHDLSDAGRTTAPALTGVPLFAPGPGLGGAGVVDDLRELFERDPDAAWRRFEAERLNTLRWVYTLQRCPWLAPALTEEETQRAFRQLADGLGADVVRYRTDQLRAIGNGVVPLQAAVACRILWDRLMQGCPGIGRAT